MLSIDFYSRFDEEKLLFLTQDRRHDRRGKRWVFGTGVWMVLMVACYAPFLSPVWGIQVDHLWWLWINCDKVIIWMFCVFAKQHTAFKWKVPISAIPVSPGSPEALVRWDEENVWRFFDTRCEVLTQSRLLFTCWKCRSSAHCWHVDQQEIARGTVSLRLKQPTPTHCCSTASRSTTSNRWQRTHWSYSISLDWINPSYSMDAIDLRQCLRKNAKLARLVTTAGRQWQNDACMLAKNTYKCHNYWFSKAECYQ